MCVPGGHEDGHIEVWDCGMLSRPNYRQTVCVPLVTLPAVAGDAYNLAYCHKHDLLLAGNDQALLLYKVEMEKILSGDKYVVTSRVAPMMEMSVLLVQRHALDSHRTISILYFIISCN